VKGPMRRLTGIDPCGLDLAEMFDELPMGLAVIDEQEIVLFLNRSLGLLTGYRCDEAAGLPARHVLHLGLPFRDMPQGGEPVTDLIDRYRRKLPVRLKSVRVSGTEADGTRRLLVVEDLSALKEIEERTRNVLAGGEILSRSASMESVKRLVQAVAQTSVPTLVTGETGTGKDLVALAIHRASPRSRAPFVTATCGPLPEHVLESELFGQAGKTELQGKFQLAHTGTLYIAEIGDLPLTQQARLVRFLDEGVIHPAGSTSGQKVDVRLIISTNRDPEELIRVKALREDLYHRLGVARIHLPPLRERGEDMDFLLAHFLELFASRLKKAVRGFSPEARRILSAYPFPGNVRELKNIVEFSVMIAGAEAIGPDELPSHVLSSNRAERRDHHKPRGDTSHPHKSGRGHAAGKGGK
jgi:PAS domain S-box-containing protein